MSSRRSTIGQVLQQAGKGQFRVSGLKAVLKRCRDERLGFRVAHSLAEQIGVATEILDGGERDGVDAVLDTRWPAAGKLAMR